MVGHRASMVQGAWLTRVPSEQCLAHKATHSGVLQLCWLLLLPSLSTHLLYTSIHHSIHPPTIRLSPPHLPLCEYTHLYSHPMFTKQHQDAWASLGPRF